MRLNFYALFPRPGRRVRKAIVEPLIIEGCRVECQNAIVKHSLERLSFEQQFELNVFIDTTFLTFLLRRPVRSPFADQSFFLFCLRLRRRVMFNEMLVTCWTFICLRLLFWKWHPQNRKA
jgi:hypothetical protein